MNDGSNHLLSTYPLLNLFIWVILFNLLSRCYYYPYLTEGKTQAQTDGMVCPWSHSQQMTGVALEPRPSSPGIKPLATS